MVRCFALIISLVFIVSSGLSYAGDKISYSPEYMKQVHQTFEKYGCVSCHDISGAGMEFTKSGKTAANKGYGCIGLQTIIITAGAKNMDGPGISTAKKAFHGQRCDECHDISGKGKEGKNLTDIGVDIYGKKLGCVSMYTAITAEKSKK